MAAARFTTIESGSGPLYWYASVFGAWRRLRWQPLPNQRKSAAIVERCSHSSQQHPEILVNLNRSSVVVEECRAADFRIFTLGFTPFTRSIKDKSFIIIAGFGSEICFSDRGASVA
jgi:hypothetical protein